MWKSVPEFEGLYEVADTGRIRSVERRVECVYGGRTVTRLYKAKILKPLLHRKGYLKVRLYRTKDDWQSFFVHRIVATAFIENPSNLAQVNHKDGNKSNNAVENLEWMTNADNMRHAFSTGVRANQSGSGASNARLTEDQVRLVVRLRGEGHAAAEIAKLVDCTQRNVRKICSGQSWSSLTGIEPEKAI
jgi:hypothetical protein